MDSNVNGSAKRSGDSPVMNDSCTVPFDWQICHVYLDDIIIWSSSIEEHLANVEAVLLALRKAHLYCSPKKMTLFCMEVTFLGHVISACGVEADASKVS